MQHSGTIHQPYDTYQCVAVGECITQHNDEPRPCDAGDSVGGAQLVSNCGGSTASRACNQGGCEQAASPSLGGFSEQDVWNRGGVGRSSSSLRTEEAAEALDFYGRSALAAGAQGVGRFNTGFCVNYRVEYVKAPLPVVWVLANADPLYPPSSHTMNDQFPPGSRAYAESCSQACARQLGGSSVCLQDELDKAGQWTAAEAASYF
jgi:hypothetical protein